MGEDVGGALWCSQEKVAEFGFALARRLYPPGRPVRVWLCERHPSNRRELILPVDGIEFRDLIDSIPSSLNALSFCVPVRCSGVEYGTDIDIRGAGFNSPAKEIAMRGPISVWMQESQSDGVLSSFDQYFAPLDAPLECTVRSAPGDRLLSLFLLLTGAGDASALPSDHAVWSYSSNCWVTPYGCNYLFHRDVREFALDFARIYAHFNWGTWITATFANNLRIWDLENAPNEYAYWDEPVGFRHYDRDERYLSFLNNLSRAAAERLANLSADEIRQLLHLVADEDEAVTVMDFADRGVLVGVAQPQLMACVFEKIAELTS